MTIIAMWTLLMNLATGATGQRLWSAQEVAEYLGIPIQTLYHWRAGRAPDGFPRGFRFGSRAVRYDPIEVRAWVQAQRDPEPVG